MDFFSTLKVLDLNADVWKLVLRLVCAILAGFFIGFERKSRSKDAGVRTHALTAFTACLLIIISKYGFFEIAQIDGINYDVSRVASNIITGLSFLGAGMIFLRRDNLHGLTTAAGILLTAAIGMCFGCGFYIVGIAATILEILIQVIFHIDCKLFRGKYYMIVRAEFNLENRAYIEEFRKTYSVKKFTKFRTKKTEKGYIAEVDFITENRLSSEELYELMIKDDHISYMEKLEEY